MGKDEYDVKLAEAQLALDKNLSAFEAASYRHKEAHEAIVQYSSSKKKKSFKRVKKQKKKK